VSLVEFGNAQVPDFCGALGSEVGRFGEDEGTEYEGKARAAKGGVGCLGVEGSRGAK
jgi:hypothetical protein